MSLGLRGLGGAVSLGLLTRAFSGWRRVIRIVVWVALFHGDCWWACRVGAPCLRDC